MSEHTPKLLPCPFCQNPQNYLEQYFSTENTGDKPDGYRVECPACRSESGEYPTELEAVQMWNRRAALSRENALAKALEEKVAAEEEYIGAKAVRDLNTDEDLDKDLCDQVSLAYLRVIHANLEAESALEAHRSAKERA